MEIFSTAADGARCVITFILSGINPSDMQLIRDFYQMFHASAGCWRKIRSGKVAVVCSASGYQIELPELLGCRTINLGR